MTTIITVHKGTTRIGRCDETCYDAVGTGCRCICGGHNHGIGRERAMHPTLQTIEDITVYLRQRFGKYPRVKVNRDIWLHLQKLPK